MIIKYKNYTDGVHLLSEKGTTAQLELSEGFTNEILVECKMDKSPHQIILDCTVSGNVTLTCDRCNEEYNMILSNTFQVACFFEKPETTEDEINIKYLTPEQDKIDISEEVWEYLMLSVPMKRLCDEECKGLCPSCGKNLNETKCDCSTGSNTSVWDPLKKLKDNLNN